MGYFRVQNIKYYYFDKMATLFNSEKFEIRGNGSYFLPMGGTKLTQEWFLLLVDADTKVKENFRFTTARSNGRNYLFL